MEVIILAGGLGTRLRSAIGNEIPKCMAPVGDKPFLWYLLKYLCRYDVTRVVFSVGHLRDIIIDWLDQSSEAYPFGIDYYVETEPLGTGGGIKQALGKCNEDNVVVLNGDTFFDVDLDIFFATHKLTPSSVSLALKPMTLFERYGRVLIDTVSHEIKAFQEKQYCEEGLINGGIYAINRNRVAWLEKAKFSFETDVLEKTVDTGNIYGFDYNAYFIDIGIPEDYERACRELPPMFQ